MSSFTVLEIQRKWYVAKNCIVGEAKSAVQNKHVISIKEGKEKHRVKRNITQLIQ